MRIRLGRRDRPAAGGARSARRGILAAPTRPPPAAPAEARGDERLVAGCMSGTSLDGIDAALVAIRGHGLAMSARYVRGTSVDLGEAGPVLRRLAEQQPVTAGQIARAAQAFAQRHLEALQALAEPRLDLVSIHGQTVLHAPPVSWQLLPPTPIAHALQVPVVYDLRAADLAAGGEGAPITPLADLVLFGRGGGARAVVNLGGFCNITLLPGSRDPAQVGGGDVCACNQLLDRLARVLWDEPYDRNGVHAADGAVDRRAFTALTALLSVQAKGGRSLGTGDELAAWIARWRERVPPADLARTACAGIAQTIVHRCREVPHLVLAGGGCRNRALVAELRSRAGGTVRTTDDLGIPAQMREAVGMAVLGALCQDRVAITLPQITHAGEATIAGCWALPTRPTAGARAAVPVLGRPRRP